MAGSTLASQSVLVRSHGTRPARAVFTTSFFNGKPLVQPTQVRSSDQRARPMSEILHPAPCAAQDGHASLQIWAAHAFAVCTGLVRRHLVLTILSSEKSVCLYSILSTADKADARPCSEGRRGPVTYKPTVIRTGGLCRLCVRTKRWPPVVPAQKTEQWTSTAS